MGKEAENVFGPGLFHIGMIKVAMKGGRSNQREETESNFKLVEESSEACG